MLERQSLFFTCALFVPFLGGRAEDISGRGSDGPSVSSTCPSPLDEIGASICSWRSSLVILIGALAIITSALDGSMASSYMTERMNAQTDSHVALTLLAISCSVSLSITRSFFSFPSPLLIRSTTFIQYHFAW